MTLWPIKKPKSRRMAAEKARPPKQAPMPRELATSRRVGRWAWTLSFYVATVALLAPPVPPMLRPGDVALRDYVAEVDFSVEDRPGTARRRVEAEKATMRVFNDNPDALLSLPGEVVRMFEKIRATASAPSVPDERLARWLSEEELAALAEGLRPGVVESVARILKEFCEVAARRGVLDEKHRQKELAADRFAIRIAGRGSGEGGAAGEGTTADLFQEVIAFPGRFSQMLDEQLERLFEGEKSETFRRALVEMVVRMAKPTLEFNESATREAVSRTIRGIKPVTSRFSAGSTLVWYGDVVTPQQALAVRAAYAAARQGLGTAQRVAESWRRLAGVAAVVAFVFMGAAVFLVRRSPDMMRSNTRLVIMGFTALASLLCARLLVAWGGSPYLTPLVMSAMLITLLCSSTFAMGISVAVAILLMVLFRGQFALSANLLIGAAVGSAFLSRVRRRTQLMEAGVLAGAAQCVAVWALGQIAWSQSYPSAQRLLHDSLAVFVNGSAFGFLLSGLLPYVERLFGFATDLSLADWADRNQPLLRRLSFDAPGTFHHSMMVGAMAEAASEAIGANPLLARAGGYLHDVGKLWKPEYFIENTQGRSSPHDSLSPMLSTLIITSHPKDGADLAEDYGLPHFLQDAIQQHHGTTVVEFFYNAALNEASDPSEIERDSFRYRGPKPATREAAIVLLADSVESATRALDAPTPARIESLVRDICRRRLMDRQLDDAAITFTDLKRIEESLIRSLLALFHQRIVYPDAKKLRREGNKPNGASAKESAGKRARGADRAPNHAAAQTGEEAGKA